MAFALLLQWVQTTRARAEDHFDTRYTYYGEDNGRIQVHTAAALFEKLLTQSLIARGEFVYDGISGASPNGAPPLDPNHPNQVTLLPMKDTRYAGNFALDWHLGVHTLSPQVSYSSESDYESLGIALNDAIELNEKNTTLRLGVALSFDEVQPSFFPEARDKDSSDFLVGVSQLLSPKTIFTADFTFGTAYGYLDDPYKVIQYEGWLPSVQSFAEKRPRYRTREVLRLTLTHHFDSLNGSAEVSYRFHHDSFDIFSHTVGLTWHQRIGKFLIVEPLVRFYEQSAASFYRLSVPGLTPDDEDPARPNYYSADYRLSNLYTLTYGVQASVIITDKLHLDVGYQRYVMEGLDDKTLASAYPKAHIVNAGLRLWF